jgi:site-specific DNA recombinase
MDEDMSKISENRIKHNTNYVSNFSEEELKIIERFQQIKKEATTKGMQSSAEKGNIVSRAPFGYIIVGKQLVPAENSDEVQDIFNEFVNTNLSLNKLASNHKLSVNGLKKILSNFTYIGKVKFNGQIHDGNHEPLISNTLFNHVQNKLQKISKSNKREDPK